MANLSDTKAVAWGGRIVHRWSWTNGVGTALCQLGRGLPRKKLLVPAIHRGWETTKKHCAKCEAAAEKLTSP